MVIHQYLATCPAGVGVYLAQELEQLGAASVVERPSGVTFEGALGLAYRVCLWSRLANRVILQFEGVKADTADGLYEAAMSIHARLHRGQFSLGVDLSGESLHRRGYRLDGGLAPLKENIAAAALWAAEWPAMSEAGQALIDPMCGSSTLLLEGALMALDRAPGLSRARFGFDHWAGHDDAQWRAIRSEADERAQAGLSTAVEIRGYDGDIQAVRRSQNNIARLGLEKFVRIRCKDLASVTRPTHKELSGGLVVANPPWGERMGNVSGLPLLYNALGDLMSREFEGWRGVVLTSDLALGKAVGLRAAKRRAFQNGRLDLHCLQFELTADNRFRDLDTAGQKPLASSPQAPLSGEAEMVANRIRKNRRRLSPWLRREGISCYRVYDADIPEYAAAVDIYDGHPHIAEYAAPKSVPDDTANRRLEALVQAVCSVFEVPARERVAVKRRERQKGTGQYQRLEQTGERLVVSEGAVKALVNLHDYLDTGLFLDHRPLRTWVSQEAKGRHFLNLFSYTGAATLHAAAGGATTSTSVDASATYLDWFGANLALNGFSDRQHRAIRADVRSCLAEETRKYYLIMLDPPSFSNSKRHDDFDVQRDH